MQSTQGQANTSCRVGTIEATEIAPLGERFFPAILDDVDARTSAVVLPDAATCDACLWELLDPHDRRYRYAFIQCADCGPRFSIARGGAFRRGQTAMDAFTMCDRCRAEYDDPTSRRHHDEANACPDCGPQLALLERGSLVASGDDALVAAVQRLSRGAIVAIKGLGGYQLAVDAGDDAAVRRLRERKRRPREPFFVMAADLAAIEAIADVDETARESLRSPARPVVLLPAGSPRGVSCAVVPGLRQLGLMLPTTPLHHLLFDGGPRLLVVTGGSRDDEPVATDDARALATLADVADAILVHDRAIHARVDDSIVRVVAGALQPVRRARGFVPDAIALDAEGPSVLAVGSEREGVVCITRGPQAFLSQPLGDLRRPQGETLLEDAIAAFSRLLGVQPAAVAHDLQPACAPTRWAARSPLPRVPVQHQHAHVASCLAEHGRDATVIGVVFDGAGCGPGAEPRGSEILLADLAGFERVGHLRPLVLPGGDTAGVGRWFEAVAAMIGAAHALTYDGQAAAELEALAWLDAESGSYAFAVEDVPAAPFQIDLRPTVRAIAVDMRRGERPSRIAARFHTTLAEAVLEVCRRVRRVRDVHVVALSGGGFQNRLLTESARALLEADGFEVLLHRRVPPNDGGLALGQAAVAASKLRRGVTGEA